MSIVPGVSLSYIVAAVLQVHIGNILWGKFNPNYYNFHVSLYVCAKEFDFLGWEVSCVYM